LCFVGRMAPEEGVRDSIDIARLSGRRLMVAAKTPSLATEIRVLQRGDQAGARSRRRHAPWGDYPRLPATRSSRAAGRSSFHRPGLSRSGWSSSRRSPAAHRNRPPRRCDLRDPARWDRRIPRGRRRTARLLRWATGRAGSVGDPGRRARTLRCRPHGGWLGGTVWANVRRLTSKGPGPVWRAALRPRSSGKQRSLADSARCRENVGHTTHGRVRTGHICMVARAS